ncbi:MAG: AraC family transcriptional regulator [Treponema sp.]|jgi:AraC-like DNA-binding protein|nr:AraC family transcriptional regulator [Treponema sp.]
MDEKTKQTYAFLKEALLKRLPKQAQALSAVKGLMFSRYNENSNPERCFYQPMIAVLIQGWKRAMIGNKEYSYGEGSCIVVGVDMPGVSHITEASPEHPFLSISIKLDPYIIIQLLAEAPHLNGQSGNSPSAVFVSEITDEILDAFLRLVKLLDNPAHIPILAPLIVREIHYRVLVSPLLGDCLRMANTIGTRANQIARSISWLREHYREPLRIKNLAHMINMAPATFHRHFQQVTTLSPLQFQKCLRLYEAERLILLEGKNANTAALEVGYESVSQFNREYKRLFGAPPLQDLNKKRSGFL